jgi:hypothetical protein
MRNYSHFNDIAVTFLAQYTPVPAYYVRWSGQEFQVSKPWAL